MVCFGSWGLLSSVFPIMIKELFLGMIFPWVLFLFSVLMTQFFHIKLSSNLAKYLSVAMLVKMVLYGLITIIIFSFMSFNPLPFIISFASYFIMLHLTEAYVLRSFINNN
tara:strand:+ start:2748 stop:3077 length:330 start_codon:yes stop_codon:yes gene_type:complete